MKPNTKAEGASSGPQPWQCISVCCRVFIVIVVGLLVAWLAIDTRKRPEQLISFGGVCLFIIAIFLFSAHRTAVSNKTHIPAHMFCWMCLSQYIYIFLDFGFPTNLIRLLRLHLPVSFPKNETVVYAKWTSFKLVWLLTKMSFALNSD